MGKSLLPQARCPQALPLCLSAPGSCYLDYPPNKGVCFVFWCLREAAMPALATRRRAVPTVLSPPA